MPELALRWILADPTVSTIIPGMRKLRHVEANIAASDGKPLDPACWSSSRPIAGTGRRRSGRNRKRPASTRRSRPDVTRISLRTSGCVPARRDDRRLDPDDRVPTRHDGDGRRRDGWHTHARANGSRHGGPTRGRLARGCGDCGRRIGGGPRVRAPSSSSDDDRRVRAPSSSSGDDAHHRDGAPRGPARDPHSRGATASGSIGSVPRSAGCSHRPDRPGPRCEENQRSTDCHASGKGRVFVVRNMMCLLWL